MNRFVGQNGIVQQHAAIVESQDIKRILVGRNRKTRDKTENP